MVEVEGVVPGQGAVEPRLEIGGPPGLELVGSAPVVLAHPAHSRVHALRTGVAQWSRSARVREQVRFRSVRDAVLRIRTRIRIRVHRIHMFLGLLDPFIIQQK